MYGMRHVILVMFLTTCGCGDDLSVQPDADLLPPGKDAPTGDAGCVAASKIHPCPAPDAAVVIIDAGVDAPPPDAAPIGQCSDVCPDEQWFPFSPQGQYWFSYCLPSYQKCCDPAQGAGAGCPLP